MADVVERLTAALADRYRIERELGAGGMATVYLARDLRHDREVAIKVLRPELAATLGPQRFLQEIQIAARLTHPHILPLHDSGQADGFLYYVMPYVEGESLRDKLSREGELPVAEAVRILKEVTDALAYAHGRGVVHRDIKPENVMLSGRHALVTDFGVAKALHEATGRQQLTTAGVALGTPAYMAPEQAAADPHMDHRADIYAVGAMGYELLTGRPPFTGASPQMVLAAHVTEPPRPVTDHRPAVPAAMAGTIMRCLEKKPADRWQTAGELLAQLEVLAATPSGGMTPTQTQPISAVVPPVALRRPRWIGLAVGGASVMVLAAIGWLVFLRAPRIDPKLILVAPFENRTGDPTLDRLGFELAERVTLGLARSGVGEPVPAAQLRELAGSAPTGSAELARKLARQTGSGLVIAGSYGGKGTLEVRAELLRMPAGKAVSVIEAVVGQESTALIDTLSERLTVAVAANTDWGDRFGWGTAHRLPRSLLAYRAYVTGDGFMVKGDGAKAAQEYRRSHSLDPSWPAPLIGLWSVSNDAAVAETLSVMSPQLQQGDKDWAQARLAATRDWETMYSAARSLLTRDSANWVGLGVLSAYATGRLAEAVRLSHLADSFSYWGHPDRRLSKSDTQWWTAWALHGLGRHREGLEVALAVRREFPEDEPAGATLELSARAALEETARVEEMVQQLEGVRYESRGGSNSISRGFLAALELRAHGQAEAAQRVAARTIRWFEQALTREKVSPDLLEGYGDVLEFAGRFDTLGGVGRSLARLAGPADSYPAMMGTYYQARAEAGRGNREAALQLMRAMPGVRNQPGLLPYYQANIMAALGDTLATMDLYRQAWAAGDWRTRMFHVRHRENPGFFLREYPPFVELTGTHQ